MMFIKTSLGCSKPPLFKLNQDAIHSARYRFLPELDIQIIDSSGVFAAVDGLFLDSDSIDDIIDKAMEVQS